MPIRLPCVTVLVAVLLGGNVRAAAAPAEERRLVVVEDRGNVLSKTTRQRLQEAIAEVAAGQGVALASAEALPARLRSCELPACLPSIAAATGAVFVLRIEAKFAQESFKLAVELWNSDDGRLLGKDRRDCPICDEQDLWGSAALMARALFEHAVGEPAKTASASIATGGPAGALAPSPVLTQSTAGPASRALRFSGLGLSVAGLAALATGIYYWHVDGAPACSDCDLVRDTRKLGVPMTIAGGAVLAAGAGLLAWSFWPGPTKVALGPSGVQVAGRF
jgi:hypothetical protein